MSATTFDTHAALRALTRAGVAAKERVKKLDASHK